MVNLFSTQILHKPLFTNKLLQVQMLKQLKQEAFQIEDMDHAGHAWSEKNYPNGYTSYSSLDRLHLMSSTFQQLQKAIDKKVMSYVKALDYDIKKNDLKMTHCWVNIMPAHVQHAAHIHPQSVISGTFYVATPAGASGLKLEDPRMNQFMNAPAVSAHARLPNQRYVTLRPKAGDVVLFESWLRHEVPANPTKQPRISISFNYGWA